MPYVGVDWSVRLLDVGEIGLFEEVALATRSTRYSVSMFIASTCMWAIAIVNLGQYPPGSEWKSNVTCEIMNISLGKCQKFSPILITRAWHVMS